jgi:uncharacterized membrane protein
MKILGHPLHVMLIHFPSALFPMDVVCSFLGYYTGNIIFSHAAFFAMAGGVLTGWLAVLTGVFDLTGMVRDKPADIKRAIYHGSINTTVLITYTLLAFIIFKKYPEIAPDHLSKVIFKSVVVALMIVGNYLGGTLVFKNKTEAEK